MRERDLKASDPYYAQWMEYRRIQWRTLGLFVLLFWGGAALSTALLATVAPQAPHWAWPVPVLPWAVAAIVASQAAIRTPCPRCGKPFHMTFWYHNGFARRCAHCGLPKWSPRDPASQRETA